MSNLLKAPYQIAPPDCAVSGISTATVITEGNFLAKDRRRFFSLDLIKATGRWTMHRTIRPNCR